ncbi:LysR family transcriptional regulator [Uliginosibacterium sp. H1]|uniref:LysR family transcriptional regulator n=1 Tax=Uliginosibacterium sp. H1 TaxID=3114757 RepID=UPI002E1776D9|nr:LysR family transcriptional regulator [Uliginosibacterium sp. H1]
MDRFDAMNVFSKVVELGSFAAAADRLGMSTSAVSRQVAQLEGLLDARLLNRTTRRISLTDNGRAYYERCLQLLSDLEEMEEQVAHSTARLRGTLRFTAPTSFGIHRLPPALGEFSARHPELGYDLALSDHAVDLIEAGLDLAIRVGNVGTQNVVARPIGHARMLVCAGEAYLKQRGEPKHPRDLLQHECMMYAYSSTPEWVFQRKAKAREKGKKAGEDEKEGAREAVRVAGRIQGNNGLLLGALAAQGLGITAAPDFILQHMVDEGSLRRILTDWDAPLLTIYAVYPTRRHLSAKVRAFVDFMEQWLKAHHPVS